MDISFWKNKDRGEIDPELFSAKAEDLARKIASESNDRTNAPTQLRKFYDEVIRFDSIVKSNPGDFEVSIPYIKMLNAKAAYAHGRESGGKPLISSGFKDFISQSLKLVNDRKMGFYKLFYEQRKAESRQQSGQHMRGGRR